MCQQLDMRRVGHILEYCQEIEKTIYRYGDSFAIFDMDADYQRSISFCILQIGELAGGLSDAYKQKTADQMQWSAMKGMRNMVAHNYVNMSRQIIWETATKDIPILKAFCAAQLQENPMD